MAFNLLCVLRCIEKLFNYRRTDRMKKLVYSAMTALMGVLLLSCSKPIEKSPQNLSPSSPSSPVQPLPSPTPKASPIVPGPSPSSEPSPLLVGVATALTVSADLDDSSIFQETIYVNLSSSESAIIHYTLDGSDPSDSSPLYTDSIAIDESSTLKFLVTDSDRRKSGIETKKYLIDQVRLLLILGI